MPITPKNLTAQLLHKARGNPPSVTPDSAISNFFPGLEFDLRAIWKHLFEGVELHESGQSTRGHRVVDVDPNGVAAAAGVRPTDRLVAVAGQSIEALPLPASAGSATRIALEFFNALADVAQRAGQTVPCRFRGDAGTDITVDLKIQPLLDGSLVNPEVAPDGSLTQGLCSPWQADYRECGCFYWSASRPDFVNSTTDAQGNITGHDWMQRARSSGDPYQPDSIGGPDHFSYEDLYTSWEQVLKFVVAGQDSE